MGKANLKLLTKEQLLSLGAQEEIVPVPELGGAVRVRGMTGIERDEWEAEQVDPVVAGQWHKLSPAQRQAAIRNRMRNIRARLVARCVVDEDGNRMFSPEDVEQLGRISGAVLNRLYEVAARLSGLRESDIEELAEVIEQNPTADSSGSGV